MRGRMCGVLMIAGAIMGLWRWVGYLVAPLEAIKTEVRSRRGDIESVTDNYAADQITDLATRAGEVNGVCIVFGNSDSGEGYIVVDGN
ncbi:Beta-glucosidase 1 [Fulvia fulva]|uniref:Beta-glucosidase 1 n=1 Tax=Passalora fulva TaxID=5499 RepID=A0A9Q8P7D5_PASFU|nr:Beta-glucosidase 1 [Fulvia fulva]KAK4626692.1 Beta-glucosidase 1 [Fulvia fulva]KAK4628435.1 Beta-glucosidase 1 [Fulvia fulva]UJO15989.1 Beta-glucosidase 1 [Fulvia fulva]WPV13135.1 Beta-glucosidase 1 [Fulvia fulva]WPV28767.1 Beta-glucosidase 1 [Fulvia fulva]